MNTRPSIEERAQTPAPTENTGLLHHLLNMARGRIEQGASKSRMLQLTIGALGLALVLSAGWGLAAGSASLSLALASSMKVPLVILLSTLTALPASLLALHLSGSTYTSSRLLASISSGVLSGALVLAALSPIVGIYYHTSAAIGSKLAIVSVFLALAVGAVVMLRNALTGLPQELSPKMVGLPVGVFTVVLMAAMLQFVAMASPILPTASAFDRGVDGLIQR